MVRLGVSVLISAGILLLVLRAAYHLSKRSAVYASLGHVRNRGQVAFSASAAAAGSLPLAGSQQSAVGAGLRHSF